ncbi:MAG TPA: hypothetical protein VI146_02835 [Nitrososphaeraceae archaeon]
MQYEAQEGNNFRNDSNKTRIYWHHHKSEKIDEPMTKWTCHICGQVVQKYSLVNNHLESHKEEQKQEIKVMAKDVKRKIR